MGQGTTGYFLEVFGYGGGGGGVEGQVAGGGDRDW